MHPPWLARILVPKLSWTIMSPLRGGQVSMPDMYIGVVAILDQPGIPQCFCGSLNSMRVVVIG